MLVGTIGMGKAADTAQRINAMITNGAPGDLVQKMRDQAHKDMQERGGHWILAEELEIINGDMVRFELWTWTKTYNGTLPLADFLKAFGGFVAASPLPIEHRTAIEVSPRSREALSRSTSSPPNLARN